MNRQELHQELKRLHRDLGETDLTDPRLQKHASPRQVAGGALTEDILKCQLKPLNAAEYLPATFTAQQLVRLYNTFPDGVCDWNKPGVGQQPPRSPLTFAAGPGGKRLGAAPASHRRGSHEDEDEQDD